MFEAYAIGVTLRLKNLISPQLLILSNEMKGLEGLVGKLHSTLAKLGSEAPGLRAIGAALKSNDAAFERASRHAATLEQRMAAIRAQSAIPIAPMFPGGLGGGGGRGPALPGPGGGGGGGGRRGNYGGHAGGFHGGNVHMGPGGIGMGTVGLGAGDAFIPLAVSAAMVYGGHALYEAAKDLNTEQARFKLFGLGDKLNAEAFKFVEGMRVYGTTQAENMKEFREAQGIFRESGLSGSEALEGAKLAAPMLAKIAFATEALDEESKAKLRTSGLSMLRWVEMSGGLKSADKFNQLADFGWRMTQTSGGAVDWEQMRQFSATSGNAGRFITPEGLAALEPLLGELKGGGAGTGLRTATNRLTGVVRLPNQAAHMLVDAGLWDESKVEWNKQGGIKRFNGNPFTSYDEFVKSPAQWYEKHMLPIYDKAGLSQEERGRDNSLIFGGTGGRLFTLIEQQMPSIHKSIEAQNKALGIDKSTAVAKEALGGQEKEFTAAWTDFKTTFGTTALPVFTTILQDSAKLLRSIGTFIQENQGLMTGIGKAIAFFDRYSSPIGTLRNMLFDGGSEKGTEYGNEGHGREKAGGAYFGYRSVAKPTSQPVQLVLRDGGRVLADVVSAKQAKAVSGNLGSGSFDLGLSQPAVNLRTN